MPIRVSAPSGPHAFVAPEDSRLGMALSGGGSISGANQAGAQMAIAGATVRSQQCVLPGCGKLPTDPIHQPED
jgi:hypothetical protein